MMRALVRMAAAVALFLPGMLDAQPSPGIAYDEVVRVVIAVSPPPAGNFAADLTAASQATPLPASRRRGGLAAIAGVLLGSRESAGSAQADRILSAGAAGFATLFRTLEGGRTERHAFYNGWERIDDPIAQIATIRKCDLDQVIRLDLRRRTYRIYPPGAEPAEVPPPEPGTPGSAAGSARITVSVLPPASLEGEDARGYDEHAEFTLSEVNGGCRAGSQAFDTRTYYGRLAAARSVCPLTPEREPYPEQAINIVASAGCRPHVLAQKSGPLAPAGRLVLYRALSWIPEASTGPAPGGYTFLTERGNLRTLGAGDAGLFSVPADFVRAP